jgi:CubicO group peptidase (beta-lactamase class C family)
MNHRRAVLLLCLLVSGVARAADMDALLRQTHVPAAGVGIIRGGKLAEVRVYGELVKGTPAPYNAIFNVASLTKPIVTMLTLKLVAEGKWQLDEPLAHYWVDPDLADDPRAQLLTTRHVLGHQTGFANWRWLEPSKKLRFQFDPGVKMQYSGEGFEYLRKALEKKFGKPLEQLTQAYIFDPLGMRDTQHAWDSHTDEARFARWHDAEGKNAYTDYKTTRVNAADDLLTTIEDYGRFGAWVINGAGLPDALFAQMIKEGHGGMGLGWEVHKDLDASGEYALIHSGSDEGVKSLIILLPKSKQGLIVFTNGDNGFQVAEPLVLESLTVGAEIMKRAK